MINFKIKTLQITICTIYILDNIISFKFDNTNRSINFDIIINDTKIW